MCERSMRFTYSEKPQMKTLFFYIKHISLLEGWVEPLYPYLKENGYDLVVLHNTRINQETAQADTNIKKDYELIDISYMSLISILRIFKKHKPVGMLALTFRSLFDLFINRIAHHLNVKTIYIEHGFFADTTALGFRMVNKKASIVRYYHYVRKYMFFILFISRNIFNELQIIYKAMKKNDYSLAQYDYALFYANYGFEKTNKLFKYAPEKVFFSGYPIAKNKKDLDELNFFLESNQTNKKNTVLFIQQPFLLDKLSNICYEEEAQYLKEIAKISINSGYEFFFQVHPRENLDRYTAVFKELEGTVLKIGFVERSIAESSIVIGHFSTALLSSIYLKKPLLLIYYPGLDESFLDYFKDVGLKIKDTNQLRKVLSEPSNYNATLARYNAFIKHHVGEGNSFEHQAEKILGVFNQAVKRTC